MPFKVAVVGTGGRGGDHVSWLKARKDVEIKAICDINEGRGKKIAEENKALFYNDYLQCFEKEDLDAVFIATPHYLHCPVSLAAMENDINVFCEKPMATTLYDCDRMIKTAKKNDLKLAIGLQMRYVPEFHYIKQAIEGAKGQKGSLGRITDVYMTARHYRGDMYYLTSSPVDTKTGVPAGPWRGRWLTEGAGILINQAVHNLDILRWVSGPFRSLSAFGGTLSEDHSLIEVEDTIGASFQCENGAVGTVICSSSNKHGEDNQLVVHGTENYIIARGGYAGNFIAKDTRYEKEDDYEIPLLSDPTKNDQVTNFFNAIKTDTEPQVNGVEGRKSIEFVRAILKSLQTGSSVQFPLIDSMSFPNLPNLG